MKPLHLFLLLLFGLTHQAFAQDWGAEVEPVKENPYKMAQFAFLEGSWKGTLGPYSIQEVWSSPSDLEMIGMFRMYTAEAVRLYEFMSLSLSLDGVILRIKHFDQFFVGAEEKEASTVFNLESMQEEPHLLKFKQTDANTWLIFESKTEDALKITLRKGSGSRPQETHFEFCRE